MLTELPAEIIYNIALHLPTVSCLTNLAQTCQRLHLLIAAEDSRIFRAFLKTRFPWIETPPFWRDASRALTSRSRALDKHAVIGRFVVPPQDAIKIGSHRGTRADTPTLGYRPAIDSYEVWNGDLWSDRKEVLAWGAADEIIVRVRQTGSHPSDKWVVFNDLDHVSSYDDICGLHLLKSDRYLQVPDDKEHLIFGRVRGELHHLSISPDDATHDYEQEFVTHGTELERIDLSDGPEPILAAHFENGSIALYHTTTDEPEVHPFARLGYEGLTRNNYSKFLSPTRLAVGTGRLENTLSISTITPDNISLYREIGSESLGFEERVGFNRKTNIVSAIVPLTGQAGGLGDVFLSTWGDRAVRLHDLRTSNPYEAMYRDTTDDNPIYCVHPFGHDRFVVGAGGDAVLKFFDLRMHSPYSYLNGRYPSFSHPSDEPSADNTNTDGIQDSLRYPRKDFSLFLSHSPPGLKSSNRGRSRGNPTSYRGPIYTMSSPSALSPTIYAGVVDGVFRLDFVSSDDLASSSCQWYEDGLALDLNADLNSPSSAPDRVLELSGYERPEPDDLTTTSKLRTQQPFWAISNDDARNEVVTGWDRRWERLDKEAPWRRHD
ncbi:hypothetical protein SI65_01548 [Aspergillus cristatus]|uniref:F-box domain-containing protein n=1 Tax=Aspergillus cristatus TaxID=573508 RepID=A0A1E3BSM3_ASPCR|nr:hypothetical protein SI65_01548 [Aspergillus cristatus]